MEDMENTLTEEEAAAAAGGTGRTLKHICDYTVEWGDTLSGIAQSFRTTVPILIAYNDISDPIG